MTDRDYTDLDYLMMAQSLIEDMCFSDWYVVDGLLHGAELMWDICSKVLNDDPSDLYLVKTRQHMYKCTDVISA